MTLDAFANRVATLLKAQGLQAVGAAGRPVERVAIVCGAGDDFLGDAARAGADVLLTGEARFHRALEAEALGIALVVAGHHATERPGVDDLADRLARAFPALQVWASRRESDPLHPLPRPWVDEGV
jgi:putative NIF3 family GTP cyclohydrolase 1 type 2